MSPLKSVLSLIRLKQCHLKEGEIYRVAGVLKTFSDRSLTLTGQGEEQIFALPSDINGKHTDPVSQNPYWHPNDHLLLLTKYQKKQFQIVSVQKLLSSKTKPRSWNRTLHQLWFQFIKEVENFFIQSGFCFTSTPCLVKCPGTESYLRFFSTHHIQASGKKKLWLASSPEIHLKKLLCRGATDIFEIHKCFRNEESGPYHLPEFWMLEWYRAYADLDALILDLEHLVRHLKNRLSLPVSPSPFVKTSMEVLFQKHCHIKLTPQSHKKHLSDFLKEKNIPHSPLDSFETLFHLVFLNFIEPHLNPHHPTIIRYYPPPLRANSQLSQTGWADRFEWYWKGVELANAFNEITDPQLQRKIFEQDIQKHKEDQLPIDEDLLSEMEAGFPPTSGIALGLERLFMVCYGNHSIFSNDFTFSQRNQ